MAATLVTPDRQPERALVLVHGGGVTREEGGFFTRLADGLGEAGVASLRFDLRGHGESEGRQEELTLATILNDIRVALAYIREATGARRLSLLGARVPRVGAVGEDDAAHVPGGERVAHLAGLPELARHARRLQQRIPGAVAASGASPAAVVVR